MPASPVSVVLPNYNGEGLIAETLDHVLDAASVYAGPTEILVVDDGSTDGSAALIEQSYPRVRLVRHRVNRGFADAVSTGIQAAENDVLVLLNSDVRVRPQFFQPLVDELHGVGVFSVSPLVLDEQGRPQFVSWSRYQLRAGKLRNMPWDLDEACRERAKGLALPALYASGGSVAMRRSGFRELGGFLDVYRPFYWEDVDLGMRGWLRGWETRFAPESQVVHAEQGTIGRLFPPGDVRAVRIRNRLTFLCLYSDPARFRSRYLPWNLGRAASALMRGDLPTVRGVVLFGRRWRTLTRLRQDLRARYGGKTLEQVLDRLSS
jgi:GT2 family glycosyltransferase